MLSDLERLVFQSIASYSKHQGRMPTFSELCRTTQSSPETVFTALQRLREQLLPIARN